MTRIETALICILSGLLWLGAYSRAETGGAAAEIAIQRLSAAPSVLTVAQEKDVAKTPVLSSGNAQLPVPLWW